jgi:flagellar FliL protein
MAQKGGMIGIVIGTLAAIGGGFGYGFLTVKPPAAAPAEHAAAPAKPPAQKPNEVKFLAPIVVNLREPANLYVRLEAALVVEPGADAAGLTAKVADDLVTYMRTVSLSEIEGPTGFQYFREDLRKRAVQIGGGKVKELLLQSFIIQ